MQTNPTPPTGGTPAIAGSQPVMMERDQMRRTLEHVSQEMLQRVADSFENVWPAVPAAKRPVAR